MHLPSTATYHQTAIIRSTRPAALAELRARQGAGEVVGAHGPVQQITAGPYAGHYAIPVLLRVRPREEPSVSRRLVIVGSVLMGFSAFCLMLLWVLSTMSAPALFLLLLSALSAFCLWLKVKYGRGRVFTFSGQGTIR